MKAFATILAKESTSAYVLKGGMVEHVMVRQPFIKAINFYYILIFLSYFDIIATHKEILYCRCIADVLYMYCRCGVSGHAAQLVSIN